MTTKTKTFWVGLLIAACTFGCAQETPHSQLGRYQGGKLDKTYVISNKPEHDEKAFEESSIELNNADWKKLQEYGPKPVWEKILTEKRYQPKNTSATPPKPEEKKKEQLPVIVNKLPGNQIQIVWKLRSFGGPSVKVSTDAGTTQKNLELIPQNLSPLIAAISNGAGKINVNALPDENVLVITCSEDCYSNVIKLLDELDRPSQQVELTAKIFEVNHDFDFQQGAKVIVNRLASDGGQGLSSVFDAKRFLEAATDSTAPVQGSVLHLMQAFQSAGISADVSFQLLSNAGLIQVVSEPRITVAVGNTGYMMAGEEIPVQSETLVNNNITIGTTYKPVGVQLYIVPQAASDSCVKLHVISIVSAISGFSPLPTMDGGTQGVVNPVIDSREAETSVSVDNGSTLVISGLRMTRTTTREEGIPGLKDVPIIGWLFKNHRTQQQSTDLYFFITPNIQKTN